ncbi:MAG: 23S rRNA (pseudouridine(1915)-N(3))-methyltransferase RlmH [bacterium]|jgi:23S rRNA (pseudouridine1915-N3)-methyltransferase
MRVFVYFVGKPKDPNARAMCEEYVKRTTRYFGCEMREVNPARFDAWARHPSATKIVLDAAGRAFDSVAFTELLSKAEMQGRDLVFLIGGFDGPPASWIAQADMLLSLSPLTFPHELARVVLLEQIYRAATAMRGHPYPR